MTDPTGCNVQGCNVPVRVHRYYNGLIYCDAHYKELLTGDFLSKYEAWLPTKCPSKRLLSLMGRLLEEFWSVHGGMITNARLRDRGFNFVKTDDGCTFEITRHPGAFNLGYVTKLIVQKWNVDIVGKSVLYLGERKWAIGDPD
ncbi:MAG: hypothetical protein J0665_20380 [Deltaproteobacteria bacterium]|nr:hypothetical protein [Deltaproteobacteria bacterium]